MKHKEEYLISIGLVLRNCRSKAFLTLKQVEGTTGISYHRLLRLESGKYEITLHELMKLSTLYGRDLYMVFYDKYEFTVVKPLKDKLSQIKRKNDEWLDQKVFMSQEHKDAWEAQEAEIRKLDEMTAGLKRTIIKNDDLEEKEFNDIDKDLNEYL